MKQPKKYCSILINCQVFGRKTAWVFVVVVIVVFIVFFGFFLTVCTDLE